MKKQRGVSLRVDDETFALVKEASKREKRTLGAVVYMAMWNYLK